MDDACEWAIDWDPDIARARKLFDLVSNGFLRVPITIYCTLLARLNGVSINLSMHFKDEAGKLQEGDFSTILASSGTKCRCFMLKAKLDTARHSAT